MNTKNIFRQLVLMAVVLLSASCATTKHNVLMGDVITFSEDAKTSWVTEKRGGKEWQSDPIVIHSDRLDYDQRAALEVKKQINNAVYGVNTSLVYALDMGLNRIKYVRKHQLKRDKTAKYYIFLLTDGLDNTSVEVARKNKQGNYKDLNAYEKKIQNKIKKIMGSGKVQNKFLIYPMLQIGKDLEEFRMQLGKSEKEFDKLCDSIMSKYAGASVGFEAPRPIVSKEYAEIEERIKSDFDAASFDFYVPKGYADKRIKMELVDEKGIKSWFEAKVTKKGKKFYLQDIKSDTRLNVIPGKKNKLEIEATNNDVKDDIVAWFHIDTLEYNNKAYKVNLERDEDLKQYFSTTMAGQEVFQYNSEYDKKAKPLIDTYFLFIMDASQSVGDQVQAEQDVLVHLLEETILKNWKKNDLTK